jgi:hypothetical protein
VPTQQDIPRLLALRETRRRGGLARNQNAALTEIERRFQQIAEPAAAMATGMLAEPVSGIVGMAALPFGADVAANAVRKTQQGLTYQPRTEAGQQGMQALQGFMQPIAETVSRQTDIASKVLAGNAGFDVNTPGGQFLTGMLPALAASAPGFTAARAIPGRRLEMGDIGAGGVGSRQRGAVGGVVAAADNSSKIRRLYHASNVEFDKFDPARVGDRMTALGLGHYLTPNKAKANQYGSKLMEFDVDTKDVLDFSNLTPVQRGEISTELLKQVPTERLAGFMQPTYKKVSADKVGLAEFKRLEEMTANYQHDRARAITMDGNEVPEGIARDLGIKPNDLVVRYVDSSKAGLENATPENILALMQEFDQTIPRKLGYKGASYGDEVAIYDPDLAVKVKKPKNVSVKPAKPATSTKGLMEKFKGQGIDSFISEKAKNIVLNKIVVPDNARSSGLGTKAMQDLIDYADKSGKRIDLTPSADFGGNKKRLTEFYKRFGFVENKGKNKDYEVSESMYRPAK